MKNYFMVLLLSAFLINGCATSPKKGIDDDITQKEVLLASIKFDPSFLDRWENKLLDKYIEAEEKSFFSRLLPTSSSSSEFANSKKEKERQSIREKLLKESESFDAGKEYLYKYTKGVVLGDYDFENQKFPLQDFGNFHFTYKTGYYPGALYIDYPKGFKPVLPIPAGKAQSILEKSLNREAKQQRRVYPMITFKLVSSTVPDESQMNAELGKNMRKRRNIVDGAKGNIDLNNLTATPGRSFTVRESNSLNDLSDEESDIRANYGERLDAVVTSLVIYSRPFHLFANQEKLFSVQYK